MSLESEARAEAVRQYNNGYFYVKDGNGIPPTRFGMFQRGALWAVSRITPVDVLAVASRHFPVGALQKGIGELWTCDCGESYDILIEHQVEKITALYRGENGDDDG